MIGKKIDEINEADLQSLIDGKIVEKKTLEYKQQLPGSSDSDTVEFLSDISSFANASGGDLVYGIIEDRKAGIPDKLEGIDVSNIDKEILWVDDKVRNGIKPRIPQIDSHPVRLSNSKWALVVRVHRSWRGPHRVTFRGHDKFYSRSSNGKFPLDVDELRTAFNLSETIIDRIKSFREDRISKIIANEIPVVIIGNARIVLHLVSIVSFNLGQSYDIGKVNDKPAMMPPMYCVAGIIGSTSTAS